MSIEFHLVRGFPVRVENSRADIATADVLARLDEALAMLARFQPRRWRHLRRDVRMIHVARFPCRGAYFPAEGACLTELTFLARRDITAAPVASSILHEATHARVHRFRERLGGGGTGVPSDGDRAREERLCRKAELAFGRSLPAALGAPVIDRALATLGLADGDVAPDIDWQVAEARQRRLDDGHR